MGNLLDIFQSKNVGGEGRIEDFSPKLTSIGQFTRLKDFAVILKSWNNILQTPKRSYTFDPSYGSDLYKYVFEPADEQTISAIIREVQSSLMRFDDRAKILSTQVKFLNNLKGFTIDITLSYEGKTGSLNTTITESQMLI